MDNTRHLFISIILALSIILIGTIGYMMIEGWNFFDALYMTVITVSTVGYREVHNVSPIGRLFTIIIVLFGVGFSLYVAGAIVQLMVEGRIRIIFGRRRLENKIRLLKNHYIVCGYGRIGRVLCNFLKRRPFDIVIIEKDPELVSSMDADGILYISGDASDESTLIKAGILKAKGLVSVLPTDTDNVFLVLTARQLNKDLEIMARASKRGAKSKLRAAGADYIESPYEMGALSMAQRIIRPTVTSFLNLAFGIKNKEIQMEEIPISKSSPLSNIILKDSGIRQKFNLIVIAIKRKNGEMIFNPPFDARIETEDTLVVVGEDANLQKLGKILSPEKNKS